MLRPAGCQLGTEIGPSGRSKYPFRNGLGKHPDDLNPDDEPASPVWSAVMPEYTYTADPKTAIPASLRGEGGWPTMAAGPSSAQADFAGS